MNAFTLTLIVIGVCGGLLLLLFKQMGMFEQRNETAGANYQGSSGGDSSPIDQTIDTLPVSVQERARTRVALKNAVEAEMQKKAGAIREEVKKHYQMEIERKDNEVKQAVTRFKEATQLYETTKRDYKKLNVEKKQTEAVVKAVADGLVVVNNKGEMLMMNPAAEKLLGVKGKEATGKSIMDQQKDERLISLSQEIEGGEEKEITIQSSNNEAAKTIRSSTAVIQNERGQTIGMVSVLTDVTKQKELDEMKNKFVSSVTHELRTPLHAIQESVHMMLDRIVGDLNPKQEKMLQLASRNIERLARLINDVLDVSKIEAGKVELRPTVFKLDALIYQAIGTFEAWTKTKKINLRPVLPEDPVEIEADHDRLNQVLINLIGNALKFTPENGVITVAVKPRKLDELGGIDGVEICVQDTGPGIVKDMQGKIFEKFVQVKGAQPGTGGSGTGLGLTISKELVELHKGKIWVESEEGKGSRFIFVIPQHPILKQ